MDVKENVKSILRAKGLLRDDLIEMLGVTQNAYYSMMRNPQLSTLQRLAETLGVTVADLVSETPPEDPNVKRRYRKLNDPTPQAQTLHCPHCGGEMKIIKV